MIARIRFIWLTALLLLGLAGRAGAADFTLRLSSWGSPSGPQVAVFVAAFQKYVEDASKGRVTVQSFPAGALVKEQDVPSAIMSRVVDISLATTGSWASVAPPAALMNSVLFRPTDAEFQAIAGAGSDLFKALDVSLRKRNVVLLAVLDNGPPMLVSRFPITEPGDLKGKPVRVYDKASAEIISRLGGAPSTMPVSDVYPAMQRGAVQAAIGGIQGVIGLKEYEVAKYMLDGNGAWGVGVTLYVMNGDALQALPPDLQKIVLAAGAAAERQTNQALIAYFAKGNETVRQHGMQITTLAPGTAAYRAFTDALAPLARQQEAKLQPDLVKQVLDAEH